MRKRSRAQVKKLGLERRTAEYVGPDAGNGSTWDFYGFHVFSGRSKAIHEEEEGGIGSLRNKEIT